jgi:hypothetical protein
MFILTFVVIFGPKKGVFSTYLSFWNFKYFNFNQILLNSSKFFFDFNLTKFNHFLLYRFQFTIITCRTTIYLLFSFWIFFFFFGESLLMILFNFSTLTDSINADYFMLFKTHTIFFLNTSSFYLSNAIMFYILFFTSCSFIFLLNLRYTFNYYYINSIWFFDFFFLFFLSYLYFKNIFFFLFFFIIISVYKCL